MHISWRHVAAKAFTSAGLCTVMFFGSGCATIVNGRTQAVTVSSEPPGANVFLGSRLLGVTPARLELKRRDEHIVLRFEKDGFAAQDIPVQRSVSGWIAGNVVALNPFQCQGLSSVDGCPGVIATNVGTLLAIDFLTGAAFTHPGLVRVVLTKAEQARPLR
jgi:hypothetical protein